MADIWRERNVWYLGSLVSKQKRSMKLVVTTNGEKSAEVIVPRWLQTSWEGLNFRRYKLMNVTESRFKNRQLHMEGYLQINGICGTERVCRSVRLP